MSELSPQEWLMALLEHYCMPGEAAEAFPAWSAELDGLIRGEVEGLQDELTRVKLLLLELADRSGTAICEINWEERACSQ